MTAQAEVVIYTTRFCPYCIMAKQLLNQEGISFTEIAVDGNSTLRQELSIKADGRTTVPQIFVNDAGIGGFDELNALKQQEKFKELFYPTSE